MTNLTDLMDEEPVQEEIGSPYATDLQEVELPEGVTFNGGRTFLAEA